LIDGDHVLGGSEAVKKWQDETIALEEQLKLLHKEQLCSTTADWNFLDGLSAGVGGLQENTHICYTADPAAMKRYALETLEYEITKLSEMSGHGNNLSRSYKLFADHKNNMMVNLCSLHLQMLANPWISRPHTPTSLSEFCTGRIR